MADTTYPLLPGEHEDIREDVADLVAEPDLWLDTPHPMLSYQKPRDFVGTDREERLRGLLRLMKFGGVS
jgi:uncharacterized protein (DUF2384 family)